MVQEGYITSLQATEDLTGGDLLTEVVTKYVERAAQTEERMAQMEAKFEEKFAIVSIEQSPHLTYYQQPPPPPPPPTHHHTPQF